MYDEVLLKKFDEKKIKTGDKVKVTSRLGSFEGILMPRPDLGDKSIIVIKQGDGYNIGVRFTSDIAIEKIPAKEETFEFPAVKVSKSKSLPEITMVYTGGTISSKIDYKSGGVHMTTKPEELLADVPELANIANISIDNPMTIPSEDMSYKDWQVVAESVAKALNKGSEGVVVTIGTDSMQFLSVALSFMLKDLSGTVAITGAQRSPDRGSSDAFMNLICSTHIAAKSKIAEVGICMHASSSDNFCNFMRGTKVRKMHTSRRDAFRPMNAPPIARVNVEGTIEFLSDYKKVGGSKKTVAETKFEPRVAIVVAYPNSDPSVLEFYAGKGYKGIIIEGMGLGHVPVSPSQKENGWVEHIKKVVDAGLIVGMTSQTLSGRVNSNVYRNLRLASGAGTIYCEDMLPEAAYAKLGWLLANHKKEDVERLLVKNLVGEITERSTYESSEPVV
jgi:glutamyl-tRNA(Gln) amidotransferase subunit D